MAKIELSTGTPAEIVHPQTGRPKAGIVLIPDIMGLRPLFDDHAARLADEQGWAVAAVEPWSGEDQELPLEERLASVARIDDAAYLRDLAAAADLLEVDRVGVMGFCMGGMFAFKAAGTGRFHRAVAFYGMIRVPEHWRGPNTIEPLEAITAPGACPVLAIIAGQDSFTPEPDVTDLRAAGAEVVVYPEAEHGFAHDASRPTHRADDTADAFARAMAFLGG
jgi:carboxymethylenebutenolidase